MEYKNSEANPEERLPWEKPEVQKLIVNLDTAGSGVGLQSGADLADAG